MYMATSELKLRKYLYGITIGGGYIIDLLVSYAQHGVALLGGESGPT